MTRLYAAKNGQLAMFKGAKAQPSSHANRGMDFEKALNAMHEYYAQKQTALVGKQYLPTQVVKGGQWAKVIDKSTVDYVGVLRGGRFVAFDAKETHIERIDLRALPEHQFEFLKEVEALGGVALVLVRFPGAVYAIPFEVWRWAVEAHGASQGVLVERYGWRATGKASINVKELPDEWKIEGCDWVKAVEAWGD